MDDTKREKARGAVAKWRAENREKHRASVRQWRKDNPEKAREKNRRDNARRTAKNQQARLERPQPTAAEVELMEAARRERACVLARIRYFAMRGQNLDRSKAWRAANPGKSSILQKAWREKNRDKVRTSKRDRKAAKRVTLVRVLTKLQRGRCAYCRIKLGDEFHVDHVMPLKRGGLDRRSNLQLTCAPCNLTKSAQHPIAFAQSLGRLI